MAKKSIAQKIDDMYRDEERAWGSELDDLALILATHWDLHLGPEPLSLENECNLYIFPDKSVIVLPSIGDKPSIVFDGLNKTKNSSQSQFRIAFRREYNRILGLKNANSRRTR
jgi:hypothetical protein